LRASAQVESAQLLESADQEGKLCLESGSALTLVERTQEWIFLAFHDQLRIQALGQDPRQRTFTDSYGTFDRDVARQFEKIGHGSEGIAFRLAGYLG
jgi:hypothetical protein